MLQVPLLGVGFSTNLTALGPAGPHCICRRGHDAACRLLLAGVWGESECSVPDAGSSAPAPAPAVSLPPEDTHRVTGEEEERSVYTGAGHCHSDADISVSDKGKGRQGVPIMHAGDRMLLHECTLSCSLQPSSFNFTSRELHTSEISG